MVIAILEALLGLALLFDGFILHAAIVLLMIMHVSILIILGPLGMNSAHGVWPWNFGCFCTLPASFWMLDHPDAADVSSWELWFNPITLAVIFVCAVIPLPSYFGKGYPQMSFMMYSSNFPAARLSGPHGCQTLQTAAAAYWYGGMTIDYTRLTSHYHVTPILSLSGDKKLAPYIADYFGVPITLTYRHRPSIWSNDRAKTIYVAEPRSSKAQSPAS